MPAVAKVTAHEQLKVGVGEADIVEQMVIDRRAYRTGLESLIAHYKVTGNDMKLRWAEDELKSLDWMPQYNYIVDAAIAGPELKAVASITEADYMYADAVRLDGLQRPGKLLGDGGRVSRLGRVRPWDLLPRVVRRLPAGVCVHVPDRGIHQPAFASFGSW